MSADGWTVDGLQSALLACLVGQTLTGTYITSVTLTESDDDQDPALAPVDCADGGVVVRYMDGSSTGTSLPSTSGGTAQRVWSHPFQVRVGINVDGVEGQRLRVDMLAFARQIINAIEAGVEPSSGTNYNIERITLARPKRHPSAQGFYLIEVGVTFRELWART